MLSTKTDNPNYLAKVVKIEKVNEHPNADRLAVAIVDHQPIITSKRDDLLGDLFVFFPLESAINKDLLAYTNSFSKKELNADQSQKGFFGNKGRVKAVRLRGILSEGYIHPVKSVNEWLASIEVNFCITEDWVGTSFDSIGEILLCEKYVIQKKEDGQKNAFSGKRAKREKRLIENQFRLHPDTKHLKREIQNINPDDHVEITHKLHGSNGVISKVLVKKKLGLLSRFAELAGVEVVKSKYDLVFSSRRVIKNEYADQNTNDYYDSDIWKEVAHRYKDCLLDGITLYGEIVGYTNTGSAIQSMGGLAYDYGCKERQSEFFVFRITYTSPSGKVFEFPFLEVINYCELFGLKYVPLYYFGKAKDIYRDLEVNEDWHEGLLNRLMSDYLEKDCFLCVNNKLPDEGIVLSKRVGGFQGFKLKSQRFLEAETAELDSGNENLEDSQ